MSHVIEICGCAALAEQNQTLFLAASACHSICLFTSLRN